MKIRHFKKKNQIRSDDRIALDNLLAECDFIYDKSVDFLINEVDEKSIFCIYDEFDQMSGFISVEDTEREIQIGELYVNQAERRKGFGKILVDRATQYSKELGYDYVTLGVSLDNTNAQKFYESQKFIFERLPKGSSLIAMKRYNSKMAYQIAGIIFELEKQFGLEKIRENIEKIEKYDDFYKYFSKKDDEKIKERLNSDLLWYVLDVIEGKEIPENKSKKAIVSAQCYYDLKQQEKVKERVEEEKNKIKKQGK